MRGDIFGRFGVLIFLRSASMLFHRHHVSIAYQVFQCGSSTSIPIADIAFIVRLRDARRLLEHSAKVTICNQAEIYMRQSKLTVFNTLRTDIDKNC